MLKTRSLVIDRRPERLGRVLRSSCMNGGIERRRHARAGFAATVTYLVEGAAAEMVGDSNDIGGGGLRLATSEALSMGTFLLLRFSIPLSGRELTARGRIVMSFYEAESKKYKHGIAFTQIEANGRDDIIRYVASRLQGLELSFERTENDGLIGG